MIETPVSGCYRLKLSLELYMVSTNLSSSPRGIAPLFPDEHRIPYIYEPLDAPNT